MQVQTEQDNSIKHCGKPRRAALAFHMLARNLTLRLLRCAHRLTSSAFKIYQKRGGPFGSAITSREQQQARAQLESIENDLEKN